MRENRKKKNRGNSRMNKEKSNSLTVAEALDILKLQQNATVHNVNDRVRSVLDNTSTSNFNKEHLLKQLEAGLFLVHHLGNGVYMCWASRISKCVPKNELPGFKRKFINMASKITGRPKSDIQEDFQPIKTPVLKRTPIVNHVYV